MDISTINLSLTREQIMCERILKKATMFFSDPDNTQVYEAWKNNKEETTNANNVHDGTQPKDT